MSGEQLDIETCPDCGRPKADETHIDGACYKGSGDVLAAGECAERTVERLRSRIAELEAALGRAEAVIAAADALTAQLVEVKVAVTTTMRDQHNFKLLNAKLGVYDRAREQLGLIAGGKTNG